MKEININLSELNKKNLTFTIPIGNSNQKLRDNFSQDFIDEQIKNEINDVTDYEKVRFKPFNDTDEIIVELMVSGNTVLTYGDLGYTDDDIKFRRNRFKNSFLKFNFYDNYNPTNKKLTFQLILFNQLNNDQRDYNGDLLDVDFMPVTYRLVNPLKNIGGNSEGFYIYWLKNSINKYPLNFYMTASYNNASNGIETQFIAYDNPIPINLLTGVEWIKYILNSIGEINEYSIVNSNRTIDITNKKINMQLYPLNLI